MESWQWFRREFPACTHWTYLNNAAVCPLPSRSRVGMESYLDEISNNGAARYPAAVAEPLSRLRRQGAELIHARPDQMFVVRSTTEGLAVAATGIDVRDGDNIVVVEHEFPANIRPWLPLRRRGVEIRFVAQRNGRVLLDDLAEAVDDRTAALSVSFVQFLSGFRIDPAPVAELCHRHDALFVVDGIQGLGAFPVDVTAMGIDFLSADGHKWLLGPEGVGLGYVSDRALNRITPAIEGWLAAERPFDFFDVTQPLKQDAARFEPGAYNLAGIRALVASLELLLEAGPERIAARILELIDDLAERLRGAGWRILSPRDRDEEKSGIVLTDRTDLDADRLAVRLLERKVVVTARIGAMRVSPHAYNDASDLDVLMEALASIG